MKAELLMIGTELLLGQIQDTNATYMGQLLADHGIDLYQKTTVGDNPERIKAALNDALDRSDVVFCSGGLGPTADDITRECVAEVAGVEMEFHPEILETIKGMFAKYASPMTENNKRQAMVPIGATVLDNPFGTAPGLMVECDRGIIFCMPGVPRELKPMLNDTILPYLIKRFDLDSTIHYRVLHICGIGESRIDQVIKELISDSTNPTVGILASPASVRIRIAAKANSREEAEALIAPVEAEVREHFPDLIMGIDDDTLEGVVDRLLCDRGWSIGIAETASGGKVASRMSAIHAESYRFGCVYPLGTLDLDDIEGLSVELARRCMLNCTSDSSLAIVADPAAGICLATFIHPEGVETWSIGRSGQTNVMQERIAILALEFLRRFLMKTT